MKYYYNFFIVSFYILSSLVSAQGSREEIDYEYDFVISKLRNEGKYEEIIERLENLIQAAEKIGYKDGITEGYALQGTYYTGLGKYKESINKLAIARKLADETDNYELKSYIASAFGNNYNAQYLSPTLAIGEFKKGVAYAEKIKDKEKQRIQICYAYDNLAAVYNNLRKEDSVLYYTRKSLEYGERAYLYNKLSYYHIYYSKNPDSVLYYLKKAENFKMAAFERNTFLLQYGDYYLMRDSYDSAAIKYKEALVISQKAKDSQGILDAYEALMDTYRFSGDSKNYIFYSEKFKKLSDSLKQSTTVNTQKTVDYIIKSQQEIHQKEKSKNRNLIITIILLSCAVLGAGIYFYYKLRQKSIRISQQKSEALQHKEQEIKELNKKVNLSFDEIVELAKSNNPEFFTRFREVYPEVVAKLLEINPKLQVSELTLCAYIYLGFPTKEIANYTFTAVSTVKKRKYNLRKKLGISADENTEMWFNNLV